MLIITKDDIKPEFRNSVNRDTIKLHHLKEEVEEKIRQNKRSLNPKTVYLQVITVSNLYVNNLN